MTRMESTTEERIAAIRELIEAAKSDPTHQRHYTAWKIVAETTWLLEALSRSRDRVGELEKDAKRLDLLSRCVVDVRKPARWGSFRIFIESPEDREGEMPEPWAIREVIDAHRAAFPEKADAQNSNPASPSVAESAAND